MKNCVNDSILSLHYVVRVEWPIFFFKNIKKAITHPTIDYRCMHYSYPIISLLEQPIPAQNNDNIISRGSKKRSNSKQLRFGI